MTTLVMMVGLTDDVGYQPPNAPEIVGKAVEKWGKDCFDAYRTRCDKTSLGFTVSGDWAFARYTDTSTDTDKSGTVTADMGKGINVSKRGADGRWRVAIDGWSSDRTAAI